MCFIIISYYYHHYYLLEILNSLEGKTNDIRDPTKIKTASSSDHLIGKPKSQQALCTRSYIVPVEPNFDLLIRRQLEGRG